MQMMMMMMMMMMGGGSKVKVGGLVDNNKGDKEKEERMKVVFSLCSQSIIVTKQCFELNG